MRLVLASALVLALVGCGSSAEETPRGGKSPAEESTSSTPPAPPMSLKETCAEIDAALPDSDLPTAAEWRGYLDKLDELKVTADTPSYEVLLLLSDPVAGLVGDPTGEDLLTSRSLLYDALDAIAARCNAVGSPALQ